MAHKDTPHRSGTQFVIIGASSLLGKEVTELLEERYPSADFRLLDDASAMGQLTEAGGEVTFIQPVTADSFENADFAIFACAPEFTLTTWELAKDAGCSMLDLSGAMQNLDTPGVVLHSPWLESGGTSTNIRTPDIAISGVIAPHPVALVLTLLLMRATHAGEILSSVANIFRPISDIGKTAMDELHQQSIQLISFKPVPKDFFDEQLTFNLLTQYGGESKIKMRDFVMPLHRQIQGLLGEAARMPAIQAVQAAVFHGQTISLFVEFNQPTDFHKLVTSLAGEHVQIVPPNEEYPNNVNTVGMDTIQVAVRADASHKNGFWIWAVADNLRLAALHAADAIKFLSASRPSKNIQ
jgi:aspartate-semialdehyde dehydrogenase